MNDDFFHPSFEDRIIQNLPRLSSQSLIIRLSRENIYQFRVENRLKTTNSFPFRDQMVRRENERVWKETAFEIVDRVWWLLLENLLEFAGEIWIELETVLDACGRF